MKKKLLALGLAFSFLFSAVSVQALTSSELLQIAKILGLSDEQSAKLQVLVKEPIKGPVCFKFEKDLRIGDKGEEVLKLSKFLMGRGLIKVGMNSWSGEVFDENLAEAVVKFQGQNGLPMTGFFGPMTRGKISSFICHPYGDDGIVSTSTVSVPVWNSNENANINSYLNIIKPEGGKKFELGDKIEVEFKSSISNVEAFIVSLRVFEGKGGLDYWLMPTVIQIPYGKGESLGGSNYRVKAVINITPEIKYFLDNAITKGFSKFTVGVEAVNYVKGGYDAVGTAISKPFSVVIDYSGTGGTKVEDDESDDDSNDDSDSDSDVESSYFNVTSPVEGGVYDNGDSQNIIVGWNAYSGSLKDRLSYYKVYLGNTTSIYTNGAPAVPGGYISENVHLYSNGYTTTVGDIRAFIEKITQKSPAPEGGYYFIVYAFDTANEIIGKGKSGIFSMPRITR